MPTVTCVEKLAPDVTLESRLGDDGAIKLVAVVTVDSRSTSEAHRAVGRAQEVLRDDPRLVERVEVRLGPGAERAILAARARRKQRVEKARRGAKGAGR